MAGGYDGSIRIDTSINGKGFSNGIKAMTNSLKGLAAAVGVAFSVVAVVAFSKTVVQSASEMASAYTGLKSIMDGQGRSFTNAKKFIQDYIADGLVPATNAVTAYKNLAMRGYADDQIQQTMVALKNSAAFGRQASLTMGQAVQSATEGLKNENSILVDNAGVTKNVSIMWKEYADSIGTTVDRLTKQQKIQAEVSGIMEESKFQAGDAAKLAGTYAGQISALSVSFLNFKVAVGDAIIPVLKQIIPYVKSVIEWLTVLFNTFGQFVQAFFGVDFSATVAATETAMNGTADSTQAAADAAGNLADNTKEANKAAKGALASFDELNVLQKNQESGGSLANTGVGITPPGGSSNNTSGVGVLDDIQAKVDVFKELMMAMLSPVTISMQNLSAALEPFKNFVATGITDIYDNFLKPIGGWVMGEGLPKFIDAITEGLAKIDWNNINASLNNLWSTLTPFAINVGEGLLWFWTNVLVPLGTYVVNDLLPAFLDTLAGAIDVLNSVIDALKPLGQWLWDNFLQPIATWTGGMIIDVLNRLAGALKGISDWINNNQGVVQTMTGIVAGFFAAWKVGELIAGIPSLIGHLVNLTTNLVTNTSAWIANTAAKIADKAETIAIAALLAGDFLKNLALSATKLATETAKWIASTAAKVAANAAQLALNIAVGAWNVIGVIATAVTTAFGAAVAFLTSPIGLVIIAIIAIITIIVLLIKNWDWVKETAGKVWDWIVDKWEDAGGWFKEHVTDPIKEKFKTALDWVKEKFETIFGGIKDFAKSTINSIIDVLNSMAQAIAKGINVLIDGLNSLPNAELPKILGGGTIGFNIPRVTAPQIPRLATGAVIPPNAEFAAILGDQRHGRNLEAPEGLIRQIIQEEIGNIEANVKIEFGGSMGQFVRELKPFIDKENIRVGRSLIKGATA